jgi:hypothetical protein
VEICSASTFRLMQFDVEFLIIRKREGVERERDGWFAKQLPPHKLKLKTTRLLTNHSNHCMSCCHPTYNILFFHSTN